MGKLGAASAIVSPVTTVVVGGGPAADGARAAPAEAALDAEAGAVVLAEGAGAAAATSYTGFPARSL